MIAMQLPSTNYPVGTSEYETLDPVSQDKTRAAITFTRENFSGALTDVVGVLTLMLSIDGTTYPANLQKSMNMRGGNVLDRNGQPAPSETLSMDLSGDFSAARRIKVRFQRNNAIRTGMTLEIL